jgi:hypothetical protein
MGALKSKILPLAISLGILAVYLSLPTRNYYWDGISFAQQIEDAPKLAPSLLHPNHLVYTAAGYLAYRLAQALGSHARALVTLQVSNSLLSAASAYLFFEILLSCLGSAYIASTLTLAFSFAATWWKFTTDANSYVPSVLLLLLCFRLLLPGRSSKPALVAVVHTLAMLFHQLSVLFYPVAVVGLLQQTSELPPRRRLFAVLQYSALALLLTGTAYYAGFYWRQDGSGNTGFSPFVSWITSHAPDSSFSWDVWSDAFYSLRGHMRLFLGGRPAWVLRQWPRFTLGMSAILVLLVSALVYWMVKRLAKCGSEFKTVAAGALGVNVRLRPLAIPAAMWIACYLLFLFFWLPANTFYRLFYLPALLLLPGIWLAQYEAGQGGRRRYGTALLVGIMAVSNLTFDIFPNSQAQSNPPLVFAMEMGREWVPGTLVYYGTFNTDDWTIRYFNPQASWKKLEPADLAALDADLQQRQGNSAAAWLDTTALDLVLSLPGGSEWLRKHTLQNARFELLDDRRRIIFRRIGPS